jgi:phage/plasmid-like protein (TIGR03299 family)
MSHEIQNAVFSQDEGTGWTGLGQAIPLEISRDPRKIAELCNATFAVEKRACFFQTADGGYKKAPGKEVVVRADTDRLLSVVSDTRYHVVNRQPIDIFEAFRDELAANNLVISHAAVLRGGADIVVCAMLPSEFDINVGEIKANRRARRILAKGDKVKSYITASTGYNGRGTIVTKGGIRVVCANTLAAAITEAMGKDMIRTIRASTQLETYSISDMIARVKTLVDAERTTYNELANTKMSNEDVSRFFADVLEVNIADLGTTDRNGKKMVSTKTENILTAMLESYTKGPGASEIIGSAWGALNAVTHYATHTKTCRDTTDSGTNAARVASNLNGDAAKLKLRALSLAAAYAEKVAA